MGSYWGEVRVTGLLYHLIKEKFFMTTFKRTPTDRSHEASAPSRSDGNPRHHTTILDALILVLYVTVPGLMGYGIGEWLTDGWMVWVATGIGVLDGSFLATILIPQSWRNSNHKHPRDRGRDDEGFD